AVRTVSITTNGFIGTATNPVREINAVDPNDTNDLLLGSVESTSDSVFLQAPHSILDADGTDDATAAANVIGVNITLTALTGEIGDQSNFLETNLLDTIASSLGNGPRDGAVTGVFTATAEQSVYATETDGDLRVFKVISRTADVTLTTRN